MTNNSRCAAACAMILGGLGCAAIGGALFAQAAGPCHDIASASVLFARTSGGLHLPVPVVQFCDRAGPLFAAYYFGYLVAAAGMLLLLRSRVSARLLPALSVCAIAIAAAVPFVPNTDPYVYAMYAYEAFVMHVSPYAPHDLQAGAIGHTLSVLFPKAGNPLRVVGYGSAFTALYALLIGPFGSASLAAMIFAERVLGGAMLALTGYLLSLLGRSPQDRTRIYIAVVLNPLMLFESVSFAHGDAAMLAALAAAFVAYRRGQLALCAASCIVAAEIRAVAIVALAPLFAELLRAKNIRGCAHAAVSAACTLIVTYALSQAVFHGFYPAGALFHTNYDAPGPIIAMLAAGDTARASMLGLAVQLCLALGLAYAALRERMYEWLPVAVIGALPVVESWYAQWLVPVAVFAKKPYRAAVLALLAIAPLKTLIDMLVLPHPALVRAGVALLAWLIPLGVYLIYSLRLPWLQMFRYYSCSAFMLALDLAVFRFAIALVSPLLAAAGSYAVTGVVHFYYNRERTFAAGGRPVLPQLARYIFIVCIGWAGTIAIVTWLTSMRVDPFQAKLVAVAALSPLGFLGHKYITYKADAQADVSKMARGA